MGSKIESLVSAMHGAPSASSVQLGPAEILISEGDVSDTVYLLVDGALQVSRQLDGATAVIALVDEPGTVVGEMVAIGGGQRTATVSATEVSRLVAVEVGDFRRLLANDPRLADLLVEVAVSRAEEGELAELLAEHFGISDEETLIATCRDVRWDRLGAGEILFREGDESDAVYFVVRGRLATTRIDSLDGEVKLGEIGRGDVVGEVGVLQHRPRSGTVTALRDTVIAEMPEQTFLGLIERQPTMMIGLFLDAVARAESPRWHSAPSTVIGILVQPGIEAEPLVSGVEKELSRLGETRRLSRSVVERSLDHPGIANCGRGSLEEVRLSRFVHETELAADFVVIEVGEEPDEWALRALGLVDQLLVCVSPTISPNEASRLIEIAQLGGSGATKTLVALRTEGVAPTGSAALRLALGSSRVVNIRARDSADIARLARLVVGRANSLVLSGGGGRGFAHLGVYRALTELGISADLVAGASMGAVLGTGIADRKAPDDVIAWAEENFRDVIDYTVPVVSLVKAEKITRNAYAQYGQRDIEDLWLTYLAVSTDLTTSRAYVHDAGSIVLAIRATSSIPGVMPPVPLGDSLLVDGGVLNNLPLDVARSHAPLGLLVASDVAPPRGPGAHGDYGLSPSGWKALLARWGGGRSPYPSISAILMRSMITASMRERDAQVREGLADCYLDLDMRGVSMLEFDSPKAVAQRGYESAMPILEGWLDSQQSVPSETVGIRP